MNKAPSSIWKNPVHFAAFGFGSGAAPFAPGTFGTLLAAVIYYFFLQHLSFWPYVILLVVGFIVGVKICDITSHDMGVHDHSGIVWDEFIGYWLAMLAAPEGWQWILAGFVIFRFFDILKPWPVKWADARIPGGVGIMIDDVIAGVYTLICLQVAARWIIPATAGG